MIDLIKKYRPKLKEMIKNEKTTLVIDDINANKPIMSRAESIITTEIENLNKEEKMMPIDEWNKQFNCKYMQQPISFLTEENLDRLQQHCEKTIQYENGRILEEHQVTLELIIRYKELKQELEKEKEKNKKAIDFINERKKTVSKDMAEGTGLQVGTFMWQVDELLEILKGIMEE